MNTTTDTIESLKQKLAQLTDLHASNVLSTAQFEEAKAGVERRIVDLVMSGATLAAATAPAAASVAAPAASSAPAAPPASTFASTPQAAAAATTAASAQATPAAKLPVKLIAGLAVGVIVIAMGGYLWKGSPTAWGGNGSQAAAADGKSGQHRTDAEQIAAMTEKLSERLKEKPDDVEGWTMLARSYSVLGRHADALKAYEKASNLRKDDPTLLADYADSLAVNSNNDLSGEPMKLIERALKIDPKNLKALYLAGTQAFNTQDYAKAVKVWEKMVEVSPPGNPFSQQVEPAIVEARKLAGMPAAAKPLDAALPGKTAGAGAAGGAGAAAGSSATSTSANANANANATVSGTVTLSAALAKQAQPDDTVFVFARAEGGSRMPLAILRKQVKDLPLTFKLDDTMAMSPANALSTASKVIVSARVSKSGNAMPQPGDFSGQSAPVSVGAEGLKIEIKELVKP